MSDTNGSERGAEGAPLAPVTPLFGHSPSERHPAHGHVRRAAGEAAPSASAPGVSRPALRALRGAGGAGEPTAEGELAEEVSAEEQCAAAEAVLLRKLRAKALSESEARLVLRGEGLTGDQADTIIDDCLRRGYLDDAVLAGLLVRAGVERKGQGRAVIARTLAQRGIPRPLIDDALAELPDDDAQRAEDYALSKAPAMRRLDPEVALRRLVGQLQRRGFGPSIALNAARQALAAGPRHGGGVRFTVTE